MRDWMCNETDRTCLLSQGHVCVADLIVCVTSKCVSFECHCTAEQIMLAFADEQPSSLQALEVIYEGLKAEVEVFQKSLQVTIYSKAYCVCHTFLRNYSSISLQWLRLQIQAPVILGTTDRRDQYSAQSTSASLKHSIQGPRMCPCCSKLLIQSLGHHKS